MIVTLKSIKVNSTQFQKCKSTLHHLQLIAGPANGIICNVWKFRSCYGICGGLARFTDVDWMYKFCRIASWIPSKLSNIANLLMSWTMMRWIVQKMIERIQKYLYNLYYSHNLKGYLKDPWYGSSVRKMTWPAFNIRLLRQRFSTPIMLLGLRHIRNKDKT